MMLCYILCCTQPYKDLLVTSYICNMLDHHSPACRFDNNDRDDIKHFILSCPKVKQFWVLSLPVDLMIILCDIEIIPLKHRFNMTNQ